jgi:integrase/recombinase XerD
MSWEKQVKPFANYLILERNLSKNSVLAYTSDLKKIAAHHSDLPLEKWDAAMISETIRQEAKKGMSPRSQSRLISAIKAYYKFLILDGAIQENPTLHLETPKMGRTLPETLTAKEISSMITSIDRSSIEGERNYCMIELLYACGLRVSELVSLSLEDLYLDEGFIRVKGKGNKERLVPVHEEAIRVLRNYLRDVRPLFLTKNDKHIFVSRRGSGLTRVMIFLIIKKVAAEAGIQKTISPHTFRHAFASHLVQNGADLRVVQELLGHESITTTEIYTHLDKRFVFESLRKYHPLSNSNR